MTAAYFNLFARQQERNRQRLREKLVRQRQSGQRSAVSGQQGALGPLSSQLPNAQLRRFEFTARGLGERGSGRDTQASGRAPARNAEHARELVHRAYPFAEVITVTPLPPA